MKKANNKESKSKKGSARGRNQETGLLSVRMSVDLGWFFDGDEREAKLMELSEALRKERERPGRMGKAETLGI